MAGMLKTTKSAGLPEVNPGDVVRVHQKIVEGNKERIQVFEGIVIKTHGKSGVNATFTVRKIAYGVGVEKTFPLISPTIVKIEFKKSSEVRRAKLYYLRKLSGKSLKMKDKKIDRDIWELVAKTDDESVELSEEVLEEAVKAEEDKKQTESTDAVVTAENNDETETAGELTPTEPISAAEQPTEEPIKSESESTKDDTVEAEVADGSSESTEAKS
ncbi:50S ribosomal protein L19 [Patescibacteria group bacterium]|nr:50S ribosomal protein L19 [Patescibacteria group bacterium]